MPSALEQEYQQVQADLKSVGDDLRRYAEKSEKELPRLQGDHVFLPERSG